MISLLFLSFSSFAAEIKSPFHFIEGDCIFPFEVVLFEAGKGESSFALRTKFIVCGYPLLDCLLFKISLAAVGEGRFAGDAFGEWAGVLFLLGLKELESGDLRTLLLEVPLLFLRTACFT